MNSLLTLLAIDEHTVWIGLKYNAQSSEWEWQSGDNLDYLNWDEDGGQPELTHSIDEYYVGLLSGIDSHPEYERYGKNAGKWHDYPVGWWTQATEGIAEVPFIRRGDSAYVIVEGPTWEEAEANANALGGHLVTINDAEENEWLLDTYKDYRNINAPNSTYERIVYIGLNDKKEEELGNGSQEKNPLGRPLGHLGLQITSPVFNMSPYISWQTRNMGGCGKG